MKILKLVFLLIAIPLLGIGQNKIDPFQIYGPYGSETFSSFNQALLNAQNCYKLKSEGEDLKKSAKRIKKLSKLYVIHLNNNNIDSFPESISTFRNLMYLKSSGNPLKKLPETIGSTPTIKTIILHHTVLDSLPDSFNKLGSLAELEIQVNNADTFFTKEAFKGLYNLKSIMLYKSNLKEFPKGLQTNGKLKKIMMIDCHLTKVDSLFGQSKSVQTLILDKNQFTVFPQEVFQLATLKELSLRENKLTSLPEKVSKIRGLEILDITGNKIPLVEIDILKALLPGCKIIY